MKEKLTQEEIIRQFAASPPAFDHNGDCRYCQAPLVRTQVNDNGALPHAPHYHYPDCAWRQAVELVGQWKKEAGCQSRQRVLVPKLVEGLYAGGDP